MVLCCCLPSSGLTSRKQVFGGAQVLQASTVFPCLSACLSLLRGSVKPCEDSKEPQEEDKKNGFRACSLRKAGQRARCAFLLPLPSFWRRDANCRASSFPSRLTARCRRCLPRVGRENFRVDGKFGLMLCFEVRQFWQKSGSQRRMHRVHRVLRPGEGEVVAPIMK